MIIIVAIIIISSSTYDYLETIIDKNLLVMITITTTDRVWIDDIYNLCLPHF